MISLTTYTIFQLVNVTLMAQWSQVVMPMESVLVKKTLEATNVRSVSKDSSSTRIVLVKFEKWRQVWYFKIHHVPCISECKCSEDGAVDSSCNDAGMCTCKSQISGDKCDKCLPGHYSFPTCQSKYRINVVIFKTITM